MLSTLRPAFLILLCITVLAGGVYPLLITGVGQLLFPAKVAGSLILRDNKPVGSELIGQGFTDPKYFWSRPSATAENPYNAAASGGSNQGPLNPALHTAVSERIAALRAADPGNTAPVPVDLVTTSASGLDPHISVAAARYQLARVARLRGMDAVKLGQLLDQHIESPQFGFLGEPRVNVVLLNLALDEAQEK